MSDKETPIHAEEMSQTNELRDEKMDDTASSGFVETDGEFKFTIFNIMAFLVSSTITYLIWSKNLHLPLPSLSY